MDALSFGGRCGAVGYRDHSRVARFNDAGSRRGLSGFAARVEPVGLRQNPPHLHPYFKASKVLDPSNWTALLRLHCTLSTTIECYPQSL